MKIKHGIIISIALFIGTIITYNDRLPIEEQKLTSIVLILWLASLGLIVYLIIRNIFRAIKGVVTGIPQGDNYRNEAQKACENVTSKRKQNTTPPWKE